MAHGQKFVKPLEASLWALPLHSAYRGEYVKIVRYNRSKGIDESWKQAWIEGSTS